MKDDDDGGETRIIEVLLLLDGREEKGERDRTKFL